MSDPFAWIDEALDDLRGRGLKRTLAVRETKTARGTCVVDGRRLVHFGSNDYLGLADDPRLAAAAKASIDELGWGAGASPVVAGRTAAHDRLEHDLAQFEGTQAALLFPSGYAANVGAITALVGRGDAVFSDAKNHASLIDGCRLSGAEVHVYRHRDVDDLQAKLRESKARKKLIATDSLFSMDGDLAPLAAIADLARRHGAMTLVDEAHATGVFGANGRGVRERLGVEDDAIVAVGTLSKALGSMGGFVVGRKSVIDWLTNRARPYFFSTAAPPAIAAAGIAALAIVRDEPARRTKLLATAESFRESLRRLGLDAGDSESQIVPVRLGEPDRATSAAAALRAAGFFVPGIRPPSVPPGESLLRVSLSYAHDEETISQLVDALARPPRG